MKQEPSFQKQHPDFVYFFDKIAWGAFTAIALYAAGQLQDMSDSITDLNKNLAVMVSKMESFDRQSLDLETRLRELEKKKGAK